MQIVHPLIKVTMEKLAAEIRALFKLLEADRNKFIQQNKDMNVKVCLGLLCFGIQ